MKKYNVIGVPWHVGHQYELAHLPFIEQYDLLINPYRVWGDKSRPMPDNMKYVTHYEKGKYDFAILHFDQQCIDDRIGKGLLYREVNELIKDIPKIVINHSVPLHDDLSKEETIQKTRELIGDNFMIVNTFEAEKMWGWGHPVIHGMDVDEWYSEPKEPRATIFVSAAGMEKVYRREILRNTINLLNDWGLKFHWIGMDVKFPNFDEYRNWLSRSLIYLNLTHESPRPRSRTEAMLSGCCVVTNRHQDADKFIVNGENGFLVSEDPVEVATLVSRLLTTDCDLAKRIGENGRKFAREEFTQEKFAKQWEEVLKINGIWRDQ